MRYSIIHHDVRELFGLTISQYLVCDSIHQLSRRGVCTLGDTEISEFLGISRPHVWKAKKILFKLELIEKLDGGITTSEKWHKAVTYKSATKNTRVLQKATEVLHFPETVDIYKEIKKDVAKATVSPYQVVSDESQTKRGTRNKEALQLRGNLYTLFEKEFGVPPTAHSGDYFRVVAALKRLKPPDIVTMVEDALEEGKKRTVREILTDRAIDIYLQDNA